MPFAASPASDGYVPRRGQERAQPAPALLGWDEGIRRQLLGTFARIGTTPWLQRTQQHFTPWDAVHTTLLNEFPAERSYGGKPIYCVVRGTDGELTIAMDDAVEVKAEILIAADGSQSSPRSSLYPGIEPDYAGQVASRGTVLERDMKPEFVAAFDDVFSFSEARSGSQPWLTAFRATTWPRLSVVAG